jgi:hypothetical protein
LNTPPRSNSPAVRVREPGLELRVDTRSAIFRAVSSQRLTAGSLPKKLAETVTCPVPRSREFDAFVCLCLEEDPHYSELTGVELNRAIESNALRTCFSNANAVIQRLCYVILNTPEFEEYNTRTSWDRIPDIVDEMNPNELFERYVLVRCEEGRSVRFPFTDVIAKYSLGVDSGFEINFERTLKSKMATTEEELGLNGTALVPKTVIDGYTLQSLISGDDGPVTVGHSQVWRVTNQRGFTNAMKFISMEYFKSEDIEAAKGFQKGKYIPKKFNHEKIVKELRRLNMDYRNRLRLPENFQFGSKYQNVGYHNLTNTCYIVMDYYTEGNMFEFTNRVVEKTNTIAELVGVLRSLHELRFSFNNITPYHIMMTYNSKNEEEYHLIDFTRMSGLGVVPEDVSSRGYASVFLLVDQPVSVYDDIESLLYCVDVFITGTVQNFVDRDDEMNKKDGLEVYSLGVRGVIEAMREHRQNSTIDEANAPMEDYIEFLDDVYGLLADRLSELFATFRSIRRIPGVELNPGEEELVDRLLFDMQASPVFAGMSNEELERTALMVKNVVMYRVEYPRGIQDRINRFLESS